MFAVRAARRQTISAMISSAMIVQLIMALLVGISLTSWTYIFRKMFAVRAARRQTIDFEKTFWAGGNLHALHQSAGSNREQSGALARIFEAGMGEFIKGKAAHAGAREMDAGAVLDGARRAMRAAFQREMDALESHLAFLASVGSVSPYIGLLGTVWGIMHAFTGLGGNFAVAGPDSPRVLNALSRCKLTVHIATKLNRTHLYPGQTGLLLPCLGRTEYDQQAGGQQFVSVEDTASMVHASTGRNRPASGKLRSEPFIVTELARHALAVSKPDLKIDWARHQRHPWQP
eukprot:gene35944-40651_t